MEQQQDLTSELDEIVPPDQAESHVAVEQEQEITQERPASQSRDHFRRLEQSKRELERELSIQREINERLLKQTPQAPPPPQAVDELDAIADDEFIPKGKVKGLIKKEAERIAQEVAQREQQKYAQQQHQATFLTRLKGQYSDFEQVVNPETLALLESNNPELAQTIVESKDPYKIGLQSYNYIKALGLHKGTDSPRAKEVEKKLATKSVQSPQAYSKRPMAQAFNPDDDRKALQDEMMNNARRSGYQY